MYHHVSEPENNAKKQRKASLNDGLGHANVNDIAVDDDELAAINISGFDVLTAWGEDDGENSSRSDDTNFYTSCAQLEKDDFLAEELEGDDLPLNLRDESLANAEKRFTDIARFTPQEIEKEQFEVYGLLPPTEEDPEMVADKLKELNENIEKLKKTTIGLYYRMAEKQSRDYVKDRKFRLKFLRSNHFCTVKAATKMMYFFEFKKNLWGEEKLTKDIMLDDFDEGTMETMRNGHWQLLPARDLAGRPIIFHNANHIRYKDPDDQLRVFTYLSRLACEDEESQKKGIVIIQYKVGEQKGLPPSRKLIWRSYQLFRGSHTDGWLHCCFSSSRFPLWEQLAKYSLGKLFVKLKLHLGKSYLDQI